jgi:hypothetical protein
MQDTRTNWALNGKTDAGMSVNASSREEAFTLNFWKPTNQERKENGQNKGYQTVYLYVFGNSGSAPADFFLYSDYHQHLSQFYQL